VLLISEFAGAAEELLGACIVNPHDTRGVASALHDALAMPRDKRQRRMRSMRDRVMRFDASAWAKSFIDDLESRSVTPEVTRDLGAAEAAIARAISRGRRVAICLDYDGTLRELVADPAMATPTPEMRELFDRLRDMENVDVTIISGRVPADLDAFLGHEYPFGMIAEHGAALRPPGSSEWEQLDRNVSYAWKRELRRVLELYEASTPGTWIEEKRTGLVWHYRQADPEFGKDKARQLTEDLSTSVANDPIQIRHGQKIVEVAATNVNKGSAVARLLEERPYDLVVVAGDDTTDESMFRLNLRNLISIKVGDGDTQAQYRIATPAAMRAFLLRAIGASGASSPQPAGRN
jgi:trehalose 6-phosphate synthase/phosphatase